MGREILFSILNGIEILFAEATDSEDFVRHVHLVSVRPDAGPKYRSLVQSCGPEAESRHIKITIYGYILS